MRPLLTFAFAAALVGLSDALGRCECAIGSKPGLYCGYCPEVVMRTGKSFGNKFLCAVNGDCIDYGGEENCVNEPPNPSHCGPKGPSPIQHGNGNGGGSGNGGSGGSGDSAASENEQGAQVSSSSGLSTGAKAGIGVGVSLGVLAIGGLIFLFWWLRRRSSKEDNSFPTSSHPRSGGSVEGHPPPPFTASSVSNVRSPMTETYSTSAVTPTSLVHQSQTQSPAMQRAELSPTSPSQKTNTVSSPDNDAGTLVARPSTAEAELEGDIIQPSSNTHRPPPPPPPAVAPPHTYPIDHKDPTLASPVGHPARQDFTSPVSPTTPAELKPSHGRTELPAF